jgi:hypothetical protein
MTAERRRGGGGVAEAQTCARTLASTWPVRVSPNPSKEGSSPCTAASMLSDEGGWSVFLWRSANAKLFRSRGSTGKAKQ